MIDRLDLTNYGAETVLALIYLTASYKDVPW